MKGNRSKMLLAAAFVLCSLAVAYAYGSYMDDFDITYPASPFVGNCNVCHTSGYGRNSYGQAYASAGHSFTNTANLDSDNDGFSNITEINAGTSPGDAASRPADTSLPVVTLTMQANSTSLTVAIAISATDNIGVTGYMVNESSIAPAANAAGWLASAPTSYAFGSAGTKTLYAWAKDAAGNVGGQSKSIIITLPDSIAPAVTLTLPATSTSLTVAIAVSATDSIGVTGYMVNESSIAPAANAPGWLASAPTSYAFGSASTKTLYAWAKDAAGNVGGQSKSVTITLPDSIAPAVTLTLPATSTSLTVAIAVSATDSVGVTGYMVTESATAPAANAAGWLASAPTSYAFGSASTKTLYAWAKDAAGNVGGQSKSITITLTDSAAPIITTFSIPETSTSLIVEIVSFEATDNVAVTGYMVTESSTPPVASSANWISRAPTSHTFSTPGAKQLYAWAKDASGNVSQGKSSNTRIEGITQDFSGMAAWQGKWFRIAIQNSRERTSETGYLNVLSWDEANQTLKSMLYTRDEESQWRPVELLLHYTSGVPLRFLGWFDYSNELAFVFGIVGVLDDDGNLISSKISAVGIAHEDAADDSEWGFDRLYPFSGSMVPASQIPSGITNPQDENDEDDEDSSDDRPLRRLRESRE